MTNEPESTSGATSHLAAPAGVSRSVFLVSVVLAVLVAGVAGLAVGWKVEQQRVKDDIANIRPVGTVTAVSDSSISVDLMTATGSRTYVVTDGTVVDGTAGGDLSDVVEGSIILVKNKRDGDGKLAATEIVVLPETTTFGGGARK